MPPKVPTPLNDDDARFWEGVTLYERSKDIRLPEPEKTEHEQKYAAFKRDHLRADEAQLIERAMPRKPVTCHDPEVKVWVPAEMAQCPYCHSLQVVSRLDPLPSRCPECWSLIDRREVK